MRHMISFAAVAILATVISAQPKSLEEVIPRTNLAIARVADLQSSPSVAKQWLEGTVTAKYAWDIDSGCFSETWLINGDVEYQQSTCKGNLITYFKPTAKCTSVKTTTNATKILMGLQTTFTNYEGIVADPFLPTKDEFYLYRSASENDWIWVRTTDNQIVYW